MRGAGSQFEGIVEPVVASLGFELWGLQYAAHRKGALLRVYIESEQGITLDDCAAVSDQLSAVLDVEDPIGVPYTLEVSSPGLDRLLFRAEQFARYVGERVKLRLGTPLDGRRRFEGRIADVDADAVTLELEDGQTELPFDAIEEARLIPEI
ncbi:MAG: ribosome maturation factor RimP [Chromatiales bacterium]|jgi:ribosome maturation factor RimP